MTILSKFITDIQRVVGQGITLDELPLDPLPYKGAIVHTIGGFYGSNGVQWQKLGQSVGFDFVPYPASETAPGEQGQAAWDGENLAICVAENTWVFLYPSRVAPE